MIECYTSSLACPSLVAYEATVEYDIVFKKQKDLK